MTKLLKNNIGLLALAAAAVYLFDRSAKALDKGVSTVTKPLVDAYVDATHDGVKYTAPGFFLNPSKLNDQYKVINDVWWRMIDDTHPKNKALRDEVFTYDRVLKPKYRHLIGNIVDPLTVQTAREAS